MTIENVQRNINSSLTCFQTHINDLPNELLLEIFSFLSYQDVLTTQLVCKKWLNISETDILWKKLCLRDFFGTTEIKESPKKTYVRCKYGIWKPSKIIDQSNVGLTRTKKKGDQLFTVTDDGKIRIKRISSRQLERSIQIPMGNRNKNFIYSISPLTVQGDHLFSFYSMYPKTFTTKFSLDLSGNVINKSSTNFEKSFAHIWSIKTGKCLKEIEGSNFGYSVYSLNENEFIFSLPNGVIKSWNLKKYKFDRELLGHTDEITCLKRYGNELITGSKDGTIRYWNLEADVCVKKLEGHQKENGIYTILRKGFQLFSGSLDHTIRLWNLETGLCEKVLEGHKNNVTELNIIGNYLVSQAADSQIKVWDIKLGECIHNFHAPKGYVSWDTIFVKNQLISLGVDKKTYVWNIETGKTEHIIDCHPVTFHRREDHLFIGCDDGSIEIFDLNKKKILQTLIGHRHAVANLSSYGDTLISSDIYGNTIQWNL